MGFKQKSLKTLKKGTDKLPMILLFIYQTYNSYKLDKKNQSFIRDFEIKINGRSRCAIVKMYYY